MSDPISVELKSDLTTIYKKAGDTLDYLQEKCFECENHEMKEVMELIKFRLEDMTGTLQKDIFNCDFLITMEKIKGGNDFTS
jgi:hypothetical protein